MKNLIISISLLFCITGTKAQINLEHTYNSGSNQGYWSHIVHFSSHGYLYALVNQNNPGMIELYNLNHSLYKQFSIPYQPGAYAPLAVEYLSDSLFNTNSSDFEYLIYFADIAGNNDIRVYNDAGNLLFSKDSVTIIYRTTYPYAEPIYYSPTGYKMTFSSQYTLQSFVYALPGALPCSECSNGNLINAITPVSRNGNGRLLNAYPNPAKNSTTIKYELPNGANQGDIIFYDLQGRQVKSFTVDRAFDSLLVSTADLSTGTYFYILRANGNYVGSKKMVIIK